MFYFKEIFFRFLFFFFSFFLLFLIFYFNRDLLLWIFSFLLLHYLIKFQLLTHFIYTHPVEILIILINLVFFFAIVFYYRILFGCFMIF